MDSTFQEWVISKEIIKDFLKGLRPDLTEEVHEHNARAILARLAQHEPPILTAFSTRIKYEE